MKTFKLDKRYNGYGKFKYAVQFHRLDQLDFIQARNWSWQTWGPAAEIENSYLMDAPWAWECTQYNLRIYLKDDKELNWFSLKWK